MDQKTKGIEIQIPGILGKVTLPPYIPEPKKPKGSHRLGIKESRLPRKPKT